MRERDIFDAALAIANPAERSAYLAKASAGKQGLRDHLEELLEMHEQLGDFLELPTPSLAANTDETPHECLGAMIGPYKLLEQIGEGGMGVVFMAEQVQPLRRKVALKVIKPGMDSKQVIARFEAERQALALMDHPNIARVIDAGATESGRPYFVMELVKGIPITEYCDQARLTARQRLELFKRVCLAVQHAHQKGIIHRDLKPGNVLVTLHDGEPVPKVIDFGIAKATGQQLTEKTMFTGFAQMVGTPIYMSPEQAALSATDVDTRSDVYALGVLLYELLTGTTPFESDTLKNVGLDEMRRIIREDEPPTPSRRLSTLSVQACSTISQRRGVDGRRLEHMLRGELDWIVTKALEKDRNRRYESASAFATDVERYLNDDAVAACPPSASYRLRKYVRRNRRTLLPAGIVALALVTATAVSSWQAVRAQDAQRQAEADRDRAKTAERQAATDAAIASAVNDFLQQDLLGQVTSAPLPAREFGGDPYLTVKEALDRAAASIGQRFREQPLVEAAIRTTIGEGYLSLTDYPRAVPHLERAVSLRKAILGRDAPDTLRSMNDLFDSYKWAGQHDDAISLGEKMLENRKAVLGPDHRDTLNYEGRMVWAYLFAGQMDASKQLAEHLFEKRLAILGPTHPETLDAMHLLARTNFFAQRYTESMDLDEKVLERLKAPTGSDSDTASWVRRTFAQACMRAGKFDKADRLLRESLDQCKRREDSQNGKQMTANCLGWLAVNLLLQGKYAAAEPYAREALDVYSRYTPELPWRFYWESVLGASLLGQQKYAEAEPLLLQGHEGLRQRATNPAAKSLVPETGGWIIRFYEATKQPEKARAWREKLKPKPPGATPAAVK